MSQQVGTDLLNAFCPDGKALCRQGRRIEKVNRPSPADRLSVRQGGGDCVVAAGLDPPGRHRLRFWGGVPWTRASVQRNKDSRPFVRPFANQLFRFLIRIRTGKPDPVDFDDTQPFWTTTPRTSPWPTPVDFGDMHPFCTRYRRQRPERLGP